jgi:hypothetical protein
MSKKSTEALGVLAKALKSMGLKSEARIASDLAIKYAGGTRIFSPEGDIYEYKRENGQVLTKKKVSKDWITVTDPKMLEAINTQIFEPQEQQRPITEPEPQEQQRNFRNDVGLNEEDTEDRTQTASAVITALKAFAMATRPIAAASRRRAPLPIVLLLQFMSLRNSSYNIGDPQMRRAAYYVCVAAEQDGSDAIDYIHYRKGQALDPSRNGAVAPTYFYGSTTDIIRSKDPYAQLSVSLGKAEYSGSRSTSYTITDGYNFNLNRDPEIIRESSQYILSIPNAEALLSRIINGEVRGGIIGAIEEVLVMYEHTMSYSGFPIAIKTAGAKEISKIT